MNIILLGAQGSGKGTQAEQLSREFRLKSVASGELLREAMARGTPLGLAAKPYYDRGDLVPDDLVVSLILESMRNLDGAQGIVLDGYPRNIPQAEVLDRRVAETGSRIDAVVYLEVPRTVLLDRLSGRYVCSANGHVWNVKTNPPRVAGVCDFDGSPLVQRSDDTPEKIDRRLDIFFTETIRLLDYYGAQGKLLRVDGTAGIDEVNQEIVRRLTTQMGVHEVAPETREEHPAGD